MASTMFVSPKPSASLAPHRPAPPPTYVPTEEEGGVAGFSLVENVLARLPALRRQTAGVQLAVGAGGGFLTGYLLGKTSKALAVFVGSSLILLQVAECHGYVKLRKHKLKQDLETVHERLALMLDNGVAEEITNGASGGGILARRPSGKEFVRLVAENARLLGGFIGGILIGFGLA